MIKNFYINECNNSYCNLKIDSEIPDLRDTIGSYADELFLKGCLNEFILNIKLKNEQELSKRQIQKETI